MMTNNSAQLEQLRKWRVRQDRDISIGTSMLQLRRSLKKGNKQLVQLLEGWDELVPSELHQHVNPVSFKSGTLEVIAKGSPIAFQLNRLIRASLLRELQVRCSGTLKQIRVRVAQDDVALE